MTAIQILERNNQVILANHSLALAMDLARGQYVIISRRDDRPARLEARTDVLYRQAGAHPRSAWPGRVLDWRQTALQDAHGAGLEAIFDLLPLTQYLSVRLHIRLYDNHPFAALRLAVCNRSSHPIAVESFSPLHAIPRDKGSVRLGPKNRPLAFLKNGYQAWSFTGALQAYQSNVSTRLGPFSWPSLTNLLAPRSSQRGVFGSEMFALLGDVVAGTGLVAGQLTTADQFAVVGADCRVNCAALQVVCQADGVQLGPGAEMASEWVYVELADLECDDPLANYMTAVARQMNARVPQSVATGWCSWYYFFQQVCEQDFATNLDTIAQAHAELPFEIVQLDDGFESDVGDWLSVNEKFPHGLSWLAKSVKERGMTPGLWLAPFIVKPTAQLENEHPEWLLRNSRGRPVSSGYNWWQWTHALDVTHPGVQDYVRQVIDTAAHKWGFPYLKLDFLYAAALPGRRHDPTTTRAQALRKGLELIREAAGDETYLLGCGCPLGPGIGIFDANRIGTDVAPNWRPREFGTEFIFGQEPGMPAARNAIRNTLVRSAMHGRWWHNDPDCLLARSGSGSTSEDEVGLTEDEVRSLASVIGLSGGLVLSSDDLPTLPPERRRYIAALLPPFGQSAKPLDLLESEMPELYVLRLERDWGQWIVAGLFNWGDAPARRVLDLARLKLAASSCYDVFDFWNERYYRVSGGQLPFDAVPPHGGHVLGIRLASDEPHVIATTFHITMGGEISDFRFKISDCACQMTIDLGRKARGQVWLGLPAAHHAQAACNEQPATIALKLPGIWAVEAEVDGQATIAVNWSQRLAQNVI